MTVLTPSALVDSMVSIPSTPSMASSTLTVISSSMSSGEAPGKTVMTRIRSRVKSGKISRGIVK